MIVLHNCIVFLKNSCLGEFTALAKAAELMENARRLSELAKQIYRLAHSPLIIQDRVQRMTGFITGTATSKIRGYSTGRNRSYHATAHKSKLGNRDGPSPHHGSVMGLALVCEMLGNVTQKRRLEKALCMSSYSLTFLTSP